MNGQKKLRYGVAYYTEYMPCERLQEDIALMQAAGINTVRIAESTWSTLEKQPGVFTFDHVDPVLDAMHAAGIDVIIGTPTYAIPSWMEKMHPEILAETVTGRPHYGARQIMDIASPAYRFYAERAIRALIGHTAGHPAVIGFQLDNETKYYGTAGENVQRGFFRHLKQKFGTTDALNSAFGLDYWSNRVDAWEDLPDPRGSINGSYRAAFDAYRRALVTEFLQWQRAIVEEYRRSGQFVTHNFDFEWRGYSFGVQPSVDHDSAAEALTMAGCDIYHPSQAELTGNEIAFGGDITRGLKDAPYLVLETEAQGFPEWTPYPGQLRLQAASHIASGAEMVEYWHWHSIHNSFETYWKGLLSHDLKPNPVYDEAKTVGALFQRLSAQLTGLHKRNKAAVLVSNAALTALENFPIPGIGGYNDVFRNVYDALYRMNVGCDVCFESRMDWQKYDAVFVPALYSCSEATISAMRQYVQDGGTLFMTYKSLFTDENVKVYHDDQPHGMTDVFGASYSLFTHETLPLSSGDTAEGFAELLVPDADAEVLLRYTSKARGMYAAYVRHTFGGGTAYYLGCAPKDMEAVLSPVLASAGITPELHWPLTMRDSYTEDGRRIRFVLNYSENAAEYTTEAVCTDLVTETGYSAGSTVPLDGWGFVILADTAK